MISDARPDRSAVLLREAYILVAYDTGLRMGDILSLRLEDIDLNGSMVVTRHKTGKPIRCQLRPETMAAIAKTVPPARELIFGGAIRVTSRMDKCFPRLFAELAGKAGGL